MMTRISTSKRCETCGRTEFTFSGFNTVKCDFCDNVYSLADNDPVLLEAKRKQALEIKELELQRVKEIEQANLEARNKRIQYAEKQRAIELKKKCRKRCIVSIIVNIFLFITFINASVICELEDTLLFVLLALLFLVLSIVRPIAIKRSNKYFWALKYPT